MFLQISLKIIAQAVVESEFASHFPTVLDIPCQRLVPSAHGGRHAVIAGIGRADEETGVIESHGSGKRYAVEGRKPSLGGTVKHVARGVRLAERQVPVHD